MLTLLVLRNTRVISSMLLLQAWQATQWHDSLTTTSDVASRAPTSTVRALCSMADQTTVKDTAEAVTICLVAPGGLPGFPGLPCPASLSATNAGTDDTTFTACAGISLDVRVRQSI